MRRNSSSAAPRLRTGSRVAALLSAALAIAYPALPQPPTHPSGDPAAASPEVRRWHFTALLNGKPIGSHDFVVSRRGEDVEVQTSAHFKVSVLLVPFYHYDHEDRETWSKGCLTTIATHTNDNGKQIEVRGSAASGKFELESAAAPTQPAAHLPDCVKTFAYWDRDSLAAAPHLLNSETGEYTPVKLARRGSEDLRVKGESQRAEHYSLQTNKLAIELWYSQSGEWLALQTRTEGGHMLRYEVQ